MSDQDTPTDGIERRSVLTAMGIGLGGVGLAQRTLADAQDGNQYVVEQAGQCVPITPLSGEETVEEFYDYRAPFTDPSGEAYSSYGTTHLQRPETSICFLYDGPEGLSLVVVHDELEDGTNGGAVTFRLDGLSDGSWVVGDDDYDAESNYDTWQETADGWRVDWTWAEGRSDGGVYRPLGDEFAVTIHPAFNEDAALHGEHYDGEITDWEVLSGDRSDPDRHALALDQPLTIRAGSCGGSTTTTTTRETTTEETTTEDEDTTTEDEETTEEEDQSSGPIRADVEILPARINPRSRGRVPVVVYSTDEFDATAVASGSVAFGPSDATPVHRTHPDEDGDGRRDLKLHFRADQLGIDWDTDSLQLTGETESGRTVVGDAGVQLVPGEDDDDESEEREREEEEEDDDDTERERETEEEREDEDEREAEDEEEREREREDDRDEDDDDDDRDDDDDDEDDDEDDDDDERGRGNGQGRGNGRGNGNGRGKGSDD